MGDKVYGLQNRLDRIFVACQRFHNVSKLQLLKLLMNHCSNHYDAKIPLNVYRFNMTTPRLTITRLYIPYCNNDGDDDDVDCQYR